MEPMTVEDILKDLYYEIELETIRRESTVKLIKDFGEFFRRNGYLTEAQERTLRKIYNEVME